MTPQQYMIVHMRILAEQKKYMQKSIITVKQKEQLKTNKRINMYICKPIKQVQVNKNRLTNKYIHTKNVELGKAKSLVSLNKFC